MTELPAQRTHGRYRIHLVCLGNICRSPMAAAVLRAKLAAAGLAGAVAVDSAGTGHWHVGKPADPRARAALVARGYADEHCARQFTARDFARYDLVVVMDAENLRDVRRLAPDVAAADAVRLLRSYDPAAPRDAAIADPYYGGPEGFDRVLDQVERACDGLVAQLRRTVVQP